MIPLLIPEIQSGELLAGFLGRVRRVNGFANDSFIEPRGSERHSKRSLMIHWASRHLGESVQNLATKHTPAAFASILHRHGNKPSSLFAHGSKISAGLSDRGIRCCPICAKEDDSWFGYSYWRVRHQLPGVLVCTTHQVPLLSSDNLEWRAFPAEIAAQHDGPSITIFDDSILIRYAMAAEAAMRLKVRPNLPVARMRLRARARALEIRCGRYASSQWQTLREFASRREDRRALSSLTGFTGSTAAIDDRRSDDFFNQLATATTERLIFLTTLLYDTPDDALYLITCPPTAQEEACTRYRADLQRHDCIAQVVDERITMPVNRSNTSNETRLAVN